MSSVYLLISHDKNRQLLSDRFAREHDVIGPETPFETAEFDLCIVDTKYFEELHEELITKKSDDEPVFLPYLLLAGQLEADDVPSEVWEVVDEVIRAPVEPAELTHRVENLLRRRRLSRQLNRQKERSEERFWSLFQAAPDPVLVTSSDGVVTEVNPAFADTFDIDAESIIGMPISDLQFSPEDAVERILLRVEEDHGEDSPEHRREVVEWDAHDGERLVTELSADAVSELGKVTERIGIFRDVTSLKEREEMLKRQNERLQEFASTIAHDLRNPLNIAQGYLDVAESDPDKEHFEAIERAHDRMEELLDEILTLAHQGQVVVDPEPIELKSVANSAWEHVYTDDATLEVSSNMRILADENRLSELLENLYRNAVEHGGDDIGVTVGTMSEGVGFYVEDDGPGIPEEDWQDIFEAGYTTTKQGTGFGLSIVRQIAEGHEWTIEATQSDNGGARFEISNVSQPDLEI